MHEMQTIVTNVHGVWLSVCHVAQLGFTVAEVIQCSLCQITLASCFLLLLKLVALSASALELGKSEQRVQVGLDSGPWCSGQPIQLFMTIAINTSAHFPDHPHTLKMDHCATKPSHPSRYCHHACQYCLLVVGPTPGADWLSIHTIKGSGIGIERYALFVKVGDVYACTITKICTWTGG